MKNDRKQPLLRALGARRAQVARIMLRDYCFMGLIAGLSGGFLGVALCLLLNNSVFENSQVVSPWFLSGVLAFVTLGAAILGAIVSYLAGAAPIMEELACAEDVSNRQFLFAMGIKVYKLRSLQS